MGTISHSTSEKVSPRARILAVCWGPLQTRKDTRQVLRPLYNCPFGIQALFFFFFFFLLAAPAALLGPWWGLHTKSARATPQPIGLSMERGAQRQSKLWARTGPPTMRNREFSRTLAVAQAEETHYGHSRCVGHPRRQPNPSTANRAAHTPSVLGEQERTLLTDTKRTNPARCLFKHAGDSATPLQRPFPVEPEDATPLSARYSEQPLRFSPKRARLTRRPQLLRCMGTRSAHDENQHPSRCPSTGRRPIRETLGGRNELR